MGTNAGLSVCCQIKKEINEREDLQRHKRFLLEKIPHATQSDYLYVLSVALGFRNRSRRRKHIISHADGQTGLFGSTNLSPRESRSDWLGRDCGQRQRPLFRPIPTCLDVAKSPTSHRCSTPSFHTSPIRMEP